LHPLHQTSIPGVLVGQGIRFGLRTTPNSFFRLFAATLYITRPDLKLRNLRTGRFPSRTSSSAFFESLENRQLLSTTLTGTSFGTAGSFNNSGNTYDKALDGNAATYFDSSQANAAYIGLDLGSAKNVTAVQITPRAGLSSRVVGAKIQGSNTSSTSGFVDLGTITSTPADGVATTISLTNPGSYRWVRYLSPDNGYGNLAELKFLSDSTTPDTSTTSSKLTGTPFGTSGSFNNSGNTFDKALDGNTSTYFDSTQATGAIIGLDLGSAKTITSVRFLPRTGLESRMTGGIFQGSNDNSSWTTLATISSQPATGQYTTLNVSNSTAFRYVRYVSPANGYGNAAEIEFYGSTSTSTTTGSSSSSGSTQPGSSKLPGTPFGTSGSFNNSGNTFDKALDSNTSTFFDSTQATGAIIGLDLGSAKTISSVRFMPRSGLESRMTGGTFQGSNDNSSWTTLATISSQPASGQYTTINVSNSTSFRYVRYVSPANGYGNAAEIEFYGSASTTTFPPVTQPVTTIPANAPQPVMKLMENNIIAGMSIHADATSTILNSGSPVTARYAWNFGDPSGKYNSLVGFNAAHIYDTPGTYTITLTVTNEAGVTNTTTQQVTVTPDTRRVIYVDSVSGNDSNNGSSTSSAVKTAARAFKLLSANTTILFKRGETFPVSDFLYAIFSNVTVSAYGSGSNPVLQWNGPADNWHEVISASAAATTNLMIENLTFNSISGKPVAIGARGTNITVRNCTFYNFDEAINAAGAPTGLLVQDNVQPANSGIVSYFLWLQGSDAVVLGNNVAPGALYAIRTSGGEGGTITRALFADNILANDDRSNLRVQKGSYCYAVGNTITNSGVEFGPLAQGDGFNDPNWATAQSDYDVFEANTLTLTDQRYVRISAGAEHISVRNNVIRHDGLGEAISIDGYDPAYNRQVVDAYILNNTVINYSTIGQMLKLVGPELDAEITVENNLYIAPNLAIGSNGNAPVYVDAPDLSNFRIFRDNVWSLPGTTNGWAAGGINFVGTSYANPDYLTPTAWDAKSQVTNDTFATVQISSNYTPSGMAASYAQAAPGVFTDIYGTLRPTFNHWSVGAVQA
jgi:hypothetical protein